MKRYWAALVLGLMLLSCQKTTTHEVMAESALEDATDGPRAVASSYVEAKTYFPRWPVPKTLRVLPVGRESKRIVMEITALQGLINRRAPEGNYLYLESPGFPDSDWRKYYVSKLNLNVVQTNPMELLDWVRQNTDIRYYIVVDSYAPQNDIDHNRACTINIANTLAGIVGNAIPTQPENIPVLEAHGFSLLPDSYCDSLGSGGRKLRRPNAFDLRNQWTAAHGNAPWETRQQAYKWALDVLLPLADHHSITLNYGHESSYTQGSPEQFEPWVNDYPIAQKQFIFYFNPAPASTEGADKTNYDYKFYRRLLEESGPMTMVRGWHWDEGSNLELISKMHCFHFGSPGQANSTVHAAVSQLFTEPLKQREVKPDEVDLDPGKVYLTFSVTDGDQPGVVYRGWQSDARFTDRASLWDDSARGHLPINWTMNGLLYAFDRGVMRYFFDKAGPNDYFIADAPVGYAWLSYKLLGPMLDKYDRFADQYLQKSGLPTVFFYTDPVAFAPVSDSSVTINIRELDHANAFVEGYRGSFYQGIYWPEARPLLPYIRNTIAAGILDYDTDRPISQKQTADDIARQIADVTQKVPYRPLFVHLTWVNWFLTPSDMQTCMRSLDKVFPGQYKLVGMPEFIALAQKAKSTGKYPLEFLAHPGGESGLEGTFLWEQKDTFTSGKMDREHPWRGTRGGFITYKFNVAPSRRASVSVDLDGDNFRVDASGDNRAWSQGIIKGSSGDRVTRTADLTPYLNSRGSVYLRFTGNVRVYHVKVNYGP